MNIKYYLKLFIVIFIIFSLIEFITVIGLNFNELYKQQNLQPGVTIEGLDSQLTSGSKAFCNTHSGFDLEQSCKKLTNYNCNLTSCCIWTSDNKCKAGNNKSGPLFNSDSKGKTHPVDYYHFQNKCYGDKCDTYNN